MGVRVPHFPPLKKDKMKFRYDDCLYEPIADGLAKEAIELAAKWNANVQTSSSIALHWARLLRMNGIIEELTIEFDQMEIICDNDGRLPKWPKGLADHECDILSQLLGARLKGR